MSQGLHLAQRLSQSLVLSPQMQQSLALLQAPTLELKALVEQELQQNPVLEEIAVAVPEQSEKTKSEDGDSEESADPAEPPADVIFDSTTGAYRRTEEQRTGRRFHGGVREARAD